MWETWRPGHHPPRFAVEIVSSDWQKDYKQSPAKYAQLGTKELIIFDPDAALGRSKNELRCPLQVYRLGDEGGVFARNYAGSGPAYSAQLDAWLVVCKERGAVRLRLARDASGKTLIPTLPERIEEEQRRAEQAQKQDEQAQKQAEQEQKRADAAEQRLRELEEELRQYKTRSSS